jgi:exodeoxyribonuclease VII large subunit
LILQGLPKFAKQMRTNSPHTLSSLSQAIKRAFQEALPASFWVKAEIHRLSVYKGTGHCYLELVEKSNGRIMAKLNATIWAAQYEAIRTSFLEITGNDLTQGMEVLLQVQVRFHELYGLSLNVVNIDASFTLGAMAKMRQETIQRLQQSGLFDRNKHLPIPKLPGRIAVISAPGSKGYHDFIQKISEYVSRYHFRIDMTLFEAQLDGDQAVRTIPEKLRQIARNPQFDVVCIIRGGGGEVGISAFDNYEIAVEICQTPIPVITGIGHSTNETVSELVSSRNCITPTDVGNLIGQLFLEALSGLDDLTKSFMRLSQDLIFDNLQVLNATSERFIRASKNQLMLEKAGLRELGVRLALLPMSTLKRSHNELDQLAISFTRLYHGRLEIENEQLDLLSLNLEKAATTLLIKQKQALEIQNDKVRLMDPQNILKRGFSITRRNGMALTGVEDFQEGETIETILANGQLISKLIEVKDGKSKELRIGN